MSLVVAFLVSSGTASAIVVAKAIVFALIIFLTFIVLSTVKFFFNRYKRYMRIIYGKSTSLPVPPIESYIFGHLRECTENDTVIDWHKQFGKLVGFFNVDRIQIRVSDLSLIDEIFLRQSRNFDARIKDYRMSLVLSSILFNKGDRWKRIRRLVQPALHQYRIARQQPSSSLASSDSGGVGGADGSSNKVDDIHRGIDTLFDYFKQLLATPTSDATTTTSSDEQNNSDTNIPPPSMQDLERGFYLIGSTAQTPTSAPNTISQKALRINVRVVMQVLTLDVIFRLAFNNNTVDVTRGGLDESLKMSQFVVEAGDSWLYRFALAVPPLRPILTPYILFVDPNLRKLKKLNKLLYGQLDMRRDNHQNDDTKSSSLPSSSLQASADQTHNTKINSTTTNNNNPQPQRISNILLDHYRKRALSRHEFNSNTAAILVAGFETTATTATYLTWCLAKYSQLQERVRKAILKDGICADYLDAFIKETMRMFPALPNFVIRTASEDTTIAGQHIKRGQSVYMSVIAVHYDPSVWPSPHTFDPDRFANHKTFPRSAYAPFGLGHRKCAGFHLAMHELKAIACALLRDYRVELVAPAEMSVESLSVFLTRPKFDVKVNLIQLAKSG